MCVTVLERKDHSFPSQLVWPHLLLPNFQLTSLQIVGDSRGVDNPLTGVNAWKKQGAQEEEAGLFLWAP